MKKDYYEMFAEKYEQLVEKVERRGFQYEDMNELMLFCNTINAHMGILSHSEVVQSDDSDFLQELIIFPKGERDHLYAIMMFAQGAISLLTNQLRQTSWVPTKKRRPPQGVKCLICVDTPGDPFFSYIGTAFGTPDGFRSAEDDVELNQEEVVAWMPLPAPWAGEEEDNK